MALNLNLDKNFYLLMCQSVIDLVTILKHAKLEAFMHASITAAFLPLFSKNAPI